MKRVIYSRQARIDLLEIGDRIEEFNPPRSVTFVTELRARADNIASFPSAYPPRDDLQKGLRMAPYGHYVILFRVTDSEVVIKRVVHGARDLPGLFRE
ncbi:MAG TPA: type II toxin-antitoxin system RelE/ParE family toxin [Rhizomicrobium sp.]